jgi:predicted acetyltransferase
MARLEAPDVGYEASYLDAVEEFLAEGRTDEAAVHDYPSFGAFVRHLRDQARGIGLPDGYVAGSTFWLVDAGVFVGRVEIRHELNDALRRFGGHVGYSVRPSRRRQGFGTEALNLALVQCRTLGIEQVLITCDVDNEASRRIIERNGGVLEDMIKVPGRPVTTMRYWIDVDAPDSARLPP